MPGRQSVSSQVSWHDFALALVSGLLLFLAAPASFNLAPLAWVALLPFFWAIKKAKPKRAIVLGLTCGLLYYTLLLSWVVIVLSTYGQMFKWLAIIALLLLALYMALYLALLGGIVCWFRPVAPLLWSAPVAWVGLDFLRSKLFTGFPWLDLGYTQFRSPLLIQTSDLVGHHGVTFLIVLANALLVTLLARKTGPSGRSAFRRRIAAALVLLSAAAAYGFLRLHHMESLDRTSDSITIAVVQGDIPQDRKWLKTVQEQTVDRYVKLSEQALASRRTNLLVWPETALPFYPLETTLFPNLVQRLVLPNRVCLLTGAPHRERADAEAPVRYYNSAFLIGPNGRSKGRYSKRHLVPFGEYIPLRWLLPFFAPIVETLGDFTPGSSAKPLSCEKARIGVLICFESIFPELARETVDQGANLLVNITNDAWFGRSNAPWQHLSMAVFRAVENRRSLARSANTGISGFIDPAGRLLELSPLFKPSYRTAAMPLLTEKTVFVRGGYFFAPLCLLLTLIGLALARIRKKPTCN